MDVNASACLMRYRGVSVSRAGAPLFEPLSFELGPGDKVVISAPVGCGKSSALLASVGEVPIDDGEILCLGKRVDQLSPRELLELRREVGYVPAQGGLLANLSLYDNLTLLARYHGKLSDADIEARSDEVCDELGLGDLRGLAFDAANQEERHLISIARAWLTRPQVLIMDDPDADLDEASTVDLWTRLATLRAAHQVAMLVATSRPAPALLHGGKHIALRTIEAP